MNLLHYSPLNYAVFHTCTWSARGTFLPCLCAPSWRTLLAKNKVQGLRSQVANVSLEILNFRSFYSRCPFFLKDFFFVLVACRSRNSRFEAVVWTSHRQFNLKRNRESRPIPRVLDFARYTRNFFLAIGLSQCSLNKDMFFIYGGVHFWNRLINTQVVFYHFLTLLLVYKQYLKISPRNLQSWSSTSF